MRESLPEKKKKHAQHEYDIGDETGKSGEMDLLTKTDENGQERLGRVR